MAPRPLWPLMAAVLVPLLSGCGLSVSPPTPPALPTALAIVLTCEALVEERAAVPELPDDLGPRRAAPQANDTGLPSANETAPTEDEPDPAAPPGEPPADHRPTAAEAARALLVAHEAPPAVGAGETLGDRVDRLERELAALVARVRELVARVDELAQRPACRCRVPAASEDSIDPDAADNQADEADEPDQLADGSAPAPGGVYIRRSDGRLEPFRPSGPAPPASTAPPAAAIRLAPTTEVRPASSRWLGPWSTPAESCPGGRCRLPR